MQQMNPSDGVIAQENARFMSRVYAWMSLGIALTGVIAFFVSDTPALFESVVGNRPLFYGLLIAQLGAVFYLSWAIARISAAAATFVYFLYAALTGITLSVIFAVYTRDSIASAFGVTAVAFAGLSGFGYLTKRDLGAVGAFCTMGLFGMVAFGLISLFFPSMMGGVSGQVYSAVGLVVFSGLTAYDTQKIKAMNIIGNEGTAEDHKEAIYGALTLYLDFINLFLNLLRLMGRRK